MKRKVIGAASLPLPYGGIACGAPCHGTEPPSPAGARRPLFAAGAEHATTQGGAKSGVLRSDTFNAKTSML